MLHGLQHHLPPTLQQSLYQFHLSFPHYNVSSSISRFPQSFNSLVDFFDRLLHRCSTSQQSRQIHAQIVSSGACASAFLAARLVSSYARFGHLSGAKRVFETAPFEFMSNLLLWNSILRAHVTHGDYHESLKLYAKMRSFGIMADGFTLPLVVRACSVMGSFSVCSLIHVHVIEMGFQSHLHVVNELLGMYGKHRRMDYALRVFDRMSARNQISWNTMVSGFALNYDPDSANGMVERMELQGLEANIVTWTSLLSSHARCGCHEETLQLFDKMRMRGIEAMAEVLAVVLSACTESAGMEKGKVIHGYVVRGGFEGYSFVKNSLICVYGKHGFVLDARKIFLEIETKSIVSWNALISSYAESGFCDEAFAVFSQLETSDGNPPVRPNLISWSAVIDGFASAGRVKESLQLFRQMQLANIMANCVTITTILSVCAVLAARNLGKEVHGHVIRASMDDSNLVGNGLINMYTKCGSLKEGHLVFNSFHSKDLISWNTMIAGYGMHGCGVQSLRTFRQMIEAGMRPDEVSFVAVLSACSHAGLVAEGRELFDQMIAEFSIEPQLEHYACMVDLLGRAGLLQEASKIVNTMPMEPNDCVWGALLNSCRLHKNTAVAEETASHIFNLRAAATGSYMLLSSVFAASGMWQDSANTRISAKTKGLKKIPGQSWIELKKKVYSFSAGKAVQKGLEEVFGVVKELTLVMENEGYNPSMSLVQDVGEEADTIWQQ